MEFKIGDLVTHNLDRAAAEITKRPVRIFKIVDMGKMNPQGYINIEIICGNSGMVTHQFALKPATKAEIALFSENFP